MPTNRRFLCAGVIALGLVLVACDDDDADVDAATPRDAATAPDAAAPPDATVPPDTGAPADADVADAGQAFTSTLALTTADEVPVCGAAAEGATGSGTVTIDAANTQIDVAVTYSGLSGPATGAHIHIGAPGVAGPIALDLGPDLTSPIARTFTADDYPDSPGAGVPADFEAFLAAVRAGQTYVNVHTEACGPGEIRGQIE